MNHESSNALASLGWSERLESELRERFSRELEPARVIGASRGSYFLRTAARETVGTLTGALAYRTADARELPAVGDWVAVRSVDGSPMRIEGIFSRSATISRKRPEEETREQILAANVDIGCIVFSLEGGRKCNPRAAERYTTTVWSSGAQPLILLNKSDLVADVEQPVLEISAVAPGIEVIATSCLTGFGLDDVRRSLRKGATAVLLGPSGVGKSMLINVLCGSARQAVGEVRRGDLKGRHTTTRRELIELPGGALVIDSPGLRELQLWAEEGDLDDSFPDVAAIAENCHFGDCSHSGEPGCAVQAALAEGALPHERFSSYLELKREVAYLERRTSDRLRRENRDRWKAINRQIRHFTKEGRSRGA